MRNSIRRLALAAALFGLVAPTRAQSVPALMNYQGQILNPDGTAPPTADYELTFRIYDAAESGNMIWGPQIFDGRSGPGLGMKIPVVQGYFNVLLGPVDTASRSLATAFESATRYLEITVSNRPPIAPRQQIVGSPFAFKAGHADRASYADQAGAASTAGLATHAHTALLATNAQNLGGVVASNVFLGLAPIGSILPFYGDPGALPSNWRLCDGTSVSDPNSPFDGQNVPDLREMFLRGASFSWSLGSSGGEDYVDGHSHYFYGYDDSVYFPIASLYGYTPAYHPANSAGGFDRSLRNVSIEDPDSSTWPKRSHGHTDGSAYVSGFTSGAGGHDNRPRFYSTHFIIRIK